MVRGAKRLQCAVYARERSGVDLRGAAGAWWNLARGQYDRTAKPAIGAVLVLGGTPKGHVAVVTKMISAREILVDHANWMNKGEIQLGALMEDGGKMWFTVNANSFREKPPLDFPVVPHNFDGEDVPGRIARRKTKWTPVSELRIA